MDYFLFKPFAYKDLIHTLKGEPKEERPSKIGNIRMCLCMYVFMYMCMYVFMYVFIRTYYIFIHTYIHTHIKLHT
jgi:hypothetical protein